jgi:hypothetical protein
MKKTSTKRLQNCNTLTSEFSDLWTPISENSDSNLLDAMINDGDLVEWQRWYEAYIWQAVKGPWFGNDTSFFD